MGHGPVRNRQPAQDRNIGEGHYTFFETTAGAESNICVASTLFRLVSGCVVARPGWPWNFCHHFWASARVQWSGVAQFDKTSANAATLSKRSCGIFAKH